MSMSVSQFLADYSVQDFFSGMGGFSYGFQRAGFDRSEGFDNWNLATQTYSRYLHSKATIVNLADYYPLKQDFQIIAVGGSPCTDFSPLNKFGSIFSKTAQLVLDFCRIVEAGQPDIMVFENVFDLPLWAETALQEIKGYKVTKNIVNAKFFGEATSRKRKIFIGSKHHYIELKNPNVSEFKTVRDVFNQMTKNWGFMNHKPATIEKFSKITSHSWMSDSENSDWSGIVRLDWNSPAKAITNVKKAQILHPSENRVISIAEALALQGFPDWYIPVGSDTQKARMIGNAIPPGVSYGIAEVIKQSYCN